MCASICFFIQSQCNRTNQVPQRGEGVELQPGFSSSANEGKTITVRDYSLLGRGPLDTVFPPPLSAGISLIPGTVAGTTDQLFCNQRSFQVQLLFRVNRASSGSEWNWIPGRHLRPVRGNTKCAVIRACRQPITRELRLCFFNLLLLYSLSVCCLSAN